MLSKFVIEGKIYLDENYEKVVLTPLGPFNSKLDAYAFVNAIGPLWGSYTVAPLYPADKENLIVLNNG